MIATGRHNHRERRTEHQSAGSGDRAEVEGVVDADAPIADHPIAAMRIGRARRVDVARHVQERGGQRDRDRDAEQPQRHSGQLRPTATQDRHHHQGPQQVELLLDRERPQVAQRRERLRSGVPGPDPDLEPVRDVADTRHDVATRAAARFGLEHRQVHHQQRQHHEQRRQQTACSTEPELLEVDVVVAFVLGDQQQGDEVAGDDEEHLDTQEPAVQPVLVGVVDHHRDHRDGAADHRDPAGAGLG